MGMGIPILHGVTGESAAIVEREETGIVFEPENAGELCDKLRLLMENRELYKTLRQQCLTAAGNYSRAELAGRMLDILMKLSKD
jgi:hypothetical protein